MSIEFDNPTIRFSVFTLDNTKEDEIIDGKLAKVIFNHPSYEVKATLDPWANT